MFYDVDAQLELKHESLVFGSLKIHLLHCLLIHLSCHIIQLMNSIHFC